MKKFLKQFIYYPFIILPLSQCVLAQTGSVKKNHLGFDLGISNYHSKDLMLSPLIQRGNNLNIALLYSHKSEQGRHSADIYFALGDLNTNVSYFTAIGIRAYLSYGYSRKLTTFEWKDAQIPFFIGGLLKSYAIVTGYEDWDSGSWIVAHSFNMTTAAEYTINPRHVLSWQFHFPLLSYIIRPPYAGFDEETSDNFEKPLKLLTKNGKLASISGYFMLGSTITYRYLLSRKFDFVAQYRFEYHRYAEPRSIKFFTNDLSLGFFFKF